ncbi:hypothetical protein [Actinokineospora sp. NBRC 105648]|uniref:hypothetical protein n=1 Tax=Actinokineospora sp. NBRC 105648 TaxID=3032206 RepID=UPI0024A54FAD|nr:hypothetical protein [Actinokineospora sp. NBRC 105648]GLZ42808.1 hypothetical protein Acsp05_64320 [Actinokineospora sp. NBRC 105648]
MAASTANLDTFWLDLYLGELLRRRWYVGPLGDPHRPAAFGASITRPSAVDVVMVWGARALAYRAPHIAGADPLRPQWVTEHYRGDVSWVLRWALTLDPQNPRRSVLYAVGPSFTTPHGTNTMLSPYAPTRTLVS